jgi:hypothetical protein
MRLALDECSEQRAVVAKATAAKSGSWAFFPQWVAEKLPCGGKELPQASSSAAASSQAPAAASPQPVPKMPQVPPEQMGDVHRQIREQVVAGMVLATEPPQQAQAAQIADGVHPAVSPLNVLQQMVVNNNPGMQWKKGFPNPDEARDNAWTTWRPTTSMEATGAAAAASTPPGLSSGSKADSGSAGLGRPGNVLAPEVRTLGKPGQEPEEIHGHQVLAPSRRPRRQLEA